MKRSEFGLFLFGCWLVLAAYTLQQAQYFEPISQWRYPWAGVLMTTGVLAVLIVALYAVTSVSFIGSRALALVGGLVIVAGILIVAFPGYSPQGVIEFFLGLPVVGLGMAIFGASCLFDWDERPRAARIIGVILFATGILAIAAVFVSWSIAVG